MLEEIERFKKAAEDFKLQNDLSNSSNRCLLDRHDVRGGRPMGRLLR